MGGLEVVHTTLSSQVRLPRISFTPLTTFVLKYRHFLFRSSNCRDTHFQLWRSHIPRAPENHLYVCPCDFEDQSSLQIGKMQGCQPCQLRGLYSVQQLLCLSLFMAEFYASQCSPTTGNPRIGSMIRRNFYFGRVLVDGKADLLIILIGSV